LNGAILGMSKADLRKKFDEIVAFAEVGKIYRHTSQAILLRHACAASVLKATDIKVGLLINFGEKIKIVRKVF